MFNYASQFRATQREMIFGREDQMVKNAAGGFAFKISPLDRLRRFLILGTEDGTYYTSPRKMTKENAKNVLYCWKTDPKGTASLIAQISDQGLAPKNDPAIFALALGTTHPNGPVREAAYGIFEKVIRIPTHLFQFCQWANEIVPLGSTRFRKAISSWYGNQPTWKLAQNVVKYQSREGWSHRDVLRLAHTKPQSDGMAVIFNWIFSKPIPEGQLGWHANVIEGFERAKGETDPKKLASLITAYNLTREMVPSQGLTHPEVWEALLAKMPLTAMIRNLGNLSKCGLLTPLSDAETKVIEKLSSAESLKAARVHPMALYLASLTYESGRGDKGHGTWTPCPRVVAALEDAFYKSYSNVTPTGKKLLVAIDSSGSMGHGKTMPIGKAAAMAMVFLNTEPNVHCISVDTRTWENGMTKRDGLSTAIQKAARGGGGTNLALPFVYAREKAMKLDGFIVLTDNETWAGWNHPQIEFEAYARGRDVKSVNVAMTATSYSIAAPDPRCLQVVGFDASVPQVVNQFLA